MNGRITWGQVKKLFRSVQKKNWQADEISALSVVGLLIVVFLGYCIIQIQNITTSINDYTSLRQEVTTKKIANHNHISKQTSILARSNLFEAAIDPLVDRGKLYILNGIIYSKDDPTHAKAIITTEGSENGIYEIGDTIAKDTQIRSISQHEVIIIRRGMIEVLSLSWEEEAKPS